MFPMMIWKSLHRNVRTSHLVTEKRHMIFNSCACQITSEISMGFGVASFQHILKVDHQRGIPKRVKKSLIYIDLFMPGPGERSKADPCPGQGCGSGTQEGRGTMSWPECG